MQSMPAQGRALDPGRIFPDTGECRQFPELFDISINHPGCNKVMKLIKYNFRLGNGFALHDISHQRRRGNGDGATGTVETDIGNTAAIQFQVDRQSVTAERVESLKLAVGASKLAEIMGTAVMIDYHF